MCLIWSFSFIRNVPANVQRIKLVLFHLYWIQTCKAKQKVRSRHLECQNTGLLAIKWTVKLQLGLKRILRNNFYNRTPIAHWLLPTSLWWVCSGSGMCACTFEMLCCCFLSSAWFRNHTLLRNCQLSQRIREYLLIYTFPSLSLCLSISSVFYPSP